MHLASKSRAKLKKFIVFKFIHTSTKISSVERLGENQASESIYAPAPQKGGGGAAAYNP
jgi:hypothetical protein